MVNEILLGSVFGRLRVLGPGGSNGKRSFLLCRCECGKEVLAEPRRLRSGHKKSCGYLRFDGEHFSRMTDAARLVTTKPVIGQQFGQLRVIVSAGRGQAGDELLLCLCDCGTSCIKRRISLVAGDTVSCGCKLRENGRTQQEKLVKAHRRAAGHPENLPMRTTSKMLRDLFGETSAAVKRLDDYTCALCRARGV